ncbi:DUF6551 family protein [Actinomadura rayongensis]|uniref:ParB N-terminal domain-containing protein n=1 Tax=Actinomadura rayongensis TaxID=1429076 RepID=A0A6I4WFU7_9ACTN|nr:DUF6551 family protein [Actinomadura rayongensis]MXQ67740.1 hypothetical protein [Actinomadura rayongensis]
MPAKAEQNDSSTPSLERLPLSKLVTDHTVNTRLLDGAWVDRRVAAYDPSALGVLSVSRRASGECVILDGQHRAELLRRAGHADTSVDCRVYDGLTPAEEAALFRRLNDSRKVQPLALFLALRAEGDAAAVEITRLAEAYGWEISHRQSSTNIYAVVALQQIYKGGPRQIGSSGNGLAVARVLQTVTRAWGHRREAVHGDLLLGIGLVFLRDGDRVDATALADRLASYPGGPAGLLGAARGVRQIQGGTVAAAVADTVIRAYNRSKRSGRLDNWE